MTVHYSTRIIKCRHCKEKLALKQATDGTWITTVSIKKIKEEAKQ